MTTRPVHLRPTYARRAFSFVEVLFAVIILGVGFILVAAIFPVGIQQTRLTVEEAAANRSAGTAIGTFTALGDSLSQISANESDPNYGSTTTPPPVPAPVWKSWYYGFPMTRPQPPAPATGTTTGPTTYPGLVLSFRDARWQSTWFFAPTKATLIPAPVQFGLTTSTVTKSPQTGLWEMVRGNLIVAAEPQYAYVPLFQRGYLRNPAANVVAPPAPPSPPGGASVPVPAPPEPIVPDHRVNITVFQLASRSRPVYQTDETAGFSDILRHPSSGNDSALVTPTSPIANLEPRLLAGARFAPHTGAEVTDLIVIPHDANNYYQAAGEGGFVVVSDDHASSALNGRVYRMGASRGTDATGSNDLWELQPGYDIAKGDGAIAGLSVDVFIVGKQLRNPGVKFDAATNPYDGPVQDIGVQTFTISAD